MANKNATKNYVSRGFLNEKEGMAAYQGTIQYYNSKLSYANFSISDCNRQVNLDFDYEGEDARKDALYKVNTLIDELTKFKEALFAD